MQPKRTVCAYARLKDKAFFEAHDFYRNDIDILRDLGYEVRLASTLGELLAAKCDLYYAWWFGYSIFPVLLGTLRRRPAVVSGVLHTLDCRGLNGWPFAKRAVMKLSMRLADCSIVCSPGEFERLDGFEPRRCEVVPLTIDTRIYRPGTGAREPVVTMITQLNRENVARKMVVEAIEAFACFCASRPQFRLRICGAIGDGIDSVRQALARHGLEARTEITGRISLERKIEVLQRSFAYLQPTTCEGFGLALGEALACGTPVITTPEVCVVGTYGDAMQYGTTPAALANALEKLHDDAAFYAQMQARGIERVSRYAYENRRELYRRIFGSIDP